jgi:hypothetical protein
MSVSAMGGSGSAPTRSMDPALAKAPVLHAGWLKKRTDMKDGKPAKNMKYDRRYCTLNATALLVRFLPQSSTPCLYSDLTLAVLALSPRAVL